MSSSTSGVNQDRLFFAEGLGQPVTYSSGSSSTGYRTSDETGSIYDEATSSQRSNTDHDVSSDPDVPKFPADLYAKNYQENYDANIACATGNDTVDRRIVQLLENNGVRCYYPPRDRSPYVAGSQSMRCALTTLPVTILPATTDCNWGLPDEELTDVILKELRVDLQRYVIVKLNSAAIIPDATVFRHMDVVDLTWDGRRAKGSEKLVVITKERIKNQADGNVRINQTDSSEDTNSAKKIQTADDEDRRRFVSVHMKEEDLCMPSGPQICSKYKESTGKKYRELHLKSRAGSNGMVHLNEIFKGLPKDSQDRGTMEEFLLGRVVPELRDKSDCLMLAQVSGMFTTKVQAAALDALRECTCVAVLDFDELVALENIISTSLQTAGSTNAFVLLAQVYSNVICSLLLSRAVNKDQVHRQPLVCNRDARCPQKWPQSDKPCQQIRLKYCKEVMKKAREMTEMSKQGGGSGKASLLRRRNKNYEDCLRSLQDAILDEASCEEDLEGHISTVLGAPWFEQFLAMKLIANVIVTSGDMEVRGRALKALQRIVYEMRNQTSKNFLFHISELLIGVLQSTRDKNLCTTLLDGLGGNTLGLRQMWDSMKIMTDKRFKDVAIQHMQEAIRPLIHHQCLAVRMHVARRLFMPSESESLVVLPSAHRAIQEAVGKAYASQGLSVSAGESKPRESNQNPKLWTWTASMGGNKRVKVNALTPVCVKDFVDGFDANSPSLRDFLRELQTMLKVSAHGNIVDVLGFQMQPRPCFIITEDWRENVSEFLTRRVEEDRLMGMCDLVRIVLRPMLAAVTYCHENGVILRDIVCANFFIQGVNGEMQVKYHNFRLAKSTTMTTQREDDGIYATIGIEGVQGCPSDPIPTRHSAPESILHYRYSRKSDSWMCSCAAYEVLTHGCQPYTELYGMPTWKVVKRVMSGYRVKQPPSIPDNIHILLMGGFLTEPTRRQTVQDFAECLRDYQESYSTPDASDLTWMLACSPPPRDNNQPIHPERGIPDFIQEDDNMSSTIYQSTDEAMKCYPCLPSEILGPDEPTLTQDGKYFVECVRTDRCTEDNEELKNLDHVNIAEVVNIEQNGDTFTQKTKFPGGLNLLQICKLKLYDVSGILGILEQVAFGLRAAHSEGWIHGCLKASYVYINEGVAKIYRWGRAIRPVVGYYDEGPFQAVHRREMPEDLRRWAPPETIFSHVFSQPGDVFMFSQLCWEAFNALSEDPNKPEEALVPYPHQRSDEVIEAVSQKERQEQPPECPDWLYKLMKKMWHSEKSMRPGFDSILQCFHSQSVVPVADPEEVYNSPLRSPMKRSRSVAQIREQLRFDEEFYSKYNMYGNGPKNDQGAPSGYARLSQSGEKDTHVYTRPQTLQPTRPPNGYKMNNRHCCPLTTACPICASKNALPDRLPGGAIRKYDDLRRRPGAVMPAIESKGRQSVRGEDTETCPPDLPYPPSSPSNVYAKLPAPPTVAVRESDPCARPKSSQHVSTQTSLRLGRMLPRRQRGVRGASLDKRPQPQLRRIAIDKSHSSTPDLTNPNAHERAAPCPVTSKVSVSSDEFENPDQTTSDGEDAFDGEHFV